jgi:hypothetical protein
MTYPAGSNSAHVPHEIYRVKYEEMDLVNQHFLANSTPHQPPGPNIGYLPPIPGSESLVLQMPINPTNTWHSIQVLFSLLTSIKSIDRNEIARIVLPELKKYSREDWQQASEYVWTMYLAPVEWEMYSIGRELKPLRERINEESLACIDNWLGNTFSKLDPASRGTPIVNPLGCYLAWKDFMGGD